MKIFYHLRLLISFRFNKLIIFLRSFLYFTDFPVPIFFFYNENINTIPPFYLRKRVSVWLFKRSYFINNLSTCLLCCPKSSSYKFPRIFSSSLCVISATKARIPYFGAEQLPEIGSDLHP